MNTLNQANIGEASNLNNNRGAQSEALRELTLSLKRFLEWARAEFDSDTVLSVLPPSPGRAQTLEVLDTLRQQVGEAGLIPKGAVLRAIDSTVVGEWADDLMILSLSLRYLWRHLPVAATSERDVVWHLMGRLEAAAEFLRETTLLVTSASARAAEGLGALCERDLGDCATESQPLPESLSEETVTA